MNTEQLEQQVRELESRGIDKTSKAFRELLMKLEISKQYDLAKERHNREQGKYLGETE